MLTPRTDSGAPRDRGARRVAVADPGAARRLRQRPDDAAAAAARADRPHAGAVHRRRAHRDDARALPARGHRGVAVPGRRHVGAGPAGARAAFDATLAFFARARTAASEPATFLLDEFLELRTFESFPGLRRVLHDCVDGARGERQPLRADQPLRRARAAAAARSLGAVRGDPHAGARPPRTRSTCSARPRAGGGDDDAHDADYLARTVQALADGRPVYVRALADELADDARARRPGQRRPDQRARRAARARRPPRQAVRLLLRAAAAPRARLRRAQGDPRDPRARKKALTLTEISQRLQRTPGSTKDYLSWLEDVDLVTSRQKRYSFTDPLLRVWVRLHCRAVARRPKTTSRAKCSATRCRGCRSPTEPPPAPQAEPAFAMAGGPPSGIIEID